MGPEGTSFISQFDLSPIVTGLNTISDNEIDKINVYPNPTTSNTIVQMALTQNQEIEFILYNIMGEVVYDKKVSEQAGTINQEIDMASLSNGVYLLKVNEDNKYLTQKIIKQN